MSESMEEGGGEPAPFMPAGSRIVAEHHARALGPEMGQEDAAHLRAARARTIPPPFLGLQLE